MEQIRSEPTASGTQPGADPSHARGLEVRELSRAQRPWHTVVWNDPINLMSYVVFVLQRHFGYSHAHAEKLMRQIHDEGRAVVSSGSRERVENDVHAMHGYGLQATMEQEDRD
ncbi:ATP-dependent Clp protease adapter ClpS [Brachybacterium hainanense]|uniref:ATP-dependent Clp protease adapter protein ClpS n=1 Tax=Brachybacterium hainanense TaxID=1541174 RepID=A0ABV6R9F3_9MICO